MSNFKLYSEADVHPDDLPILKAAETFLNLSGAIRTPLPLTGALHCFDDAKARIYEIAFHWVDGDRELVVTVGAMPTILHRHMNSVPLVSGRFGEYLSRGKELGISTPLLIELMEEINESMLGLGYSPAQIEEDLDFSEIPIALYTQPNHTLAFVSMVEADQKAFGKRPVEIKQH